MYRAFTLATGESVTDGQGGCSPKFLVTSFMADISSRSDKRTGCVRTERKAGIWKRVPFPIMLREKSGHPEHSNQRLYFQSLNLTRLKCISLKTENPRKPGVDKI